jgi:hypothetical protein
MSNLLHVNINSILNEKLRDFANDNGGYPIAWEDVQYDPTYGTIYLEQYYLPAQPESYINGDREQGIYQVNVNVPLDDGRGVALGIVDAIRSYFGRVIVGESAGRVGIIQSYLSVPQRDDSWYTEILNFQWEAM